MSNKLLIATMSCLLIFAACGDDYSSRRNNPVIDYMAMEDDSATKISEWYDDLVQECSVLKGRASASIMDDHAVAYCRELLGMNALPKSSSSRAKSSSSQVSSSSAAPKSSAQEKTSSSFVESSSSQEESSSSEVSSSSLYVEGKLVDERDGLEYRIVTVHGQTWMAENLRYKVPNPVDSDGKELYAWSFCYGEGLEGVSKDSSDNNCEMYGRLYTWAAAMDSVHTNCGAGTMCDAENYTQGICPEGWHIPEYNEYKYFQSFPPDSSGSLAWMKHRTWDRGTDVYRFSLLPAGTRQREDFYIELNNASYLWTSSYDSANGAIRSAYSWDVGRGDTGNYAMMGLHMLNVGFSVRCIRDDSITVF